MMMMMIMIIILPMKVAHQWLKLHVFRVTAVLFTLLCIAAACIIGLVYYINGPGGLSKQQQRVDLLEYYFKVNLHFDNSFRATGW